LTSNLPQQPIFADSVYGCCEWEDCEYNCEFVIVPVELVIAEIAAVGIVTADNVTVETVITDIVILTVMFSLFVRSEQGRW
jgi:hypothetical protein